MDVILAISAASGAIYSRQILERLIADKGVGRIALIQSRFSREVARHEGVTLPSSDKIEVMEYDNLFASVASGSARWDAMIIAPCSVGTVGRLASGVSDSLITRAGDVMLKERRRLVLVLRESPLSTIHLRNMTLLSEAGAIIMPASPSFYSAECDMESLASSVSNRAVELIGVKSNMQSWGDPHK